MKRLIIILWGCCLFPIVVFAQSEKTKQLTFSEDEFVFEKVGEGVNINSTNRPVSYGPEVNQPALPYILEYIPLDANMEYDGFSFSTEKSLVKSDIFLNAYQPPIPSSATDYSAIPNEYPLGIYPSNTIKFSGVFSIGGCKKVCLLISPFKYDANTHKLYLHTSLQITIKQKRTMENGNSVLANSPIKSLNNIGTSKEYNVPTISDYPTKYIIVTNNNLKAVFQDLADWKTMKGIKTIILTTEDIYAQYTGATPQLKIKAALKDYYNGTHQGLKYVLLAGDIDIVPTQMCHIKYIYNSGSNTRTFTNTTPTDWFYGCLDTDNLSWDSNNNNTVGEFEDSVDLTAEVVVSRMPARNPEEATIMVKRVIDYEQNPSVANWEDNVLTCGRVYDVSQTINGQSDAHRNGDNVYNHGISPYWDGEWYRLYDTGTDFGTGYYFNTDHLKEQLSNGFSFVHVETHGKETAFKTGNGIHTPEEWQEYDTLDATIQENIGYTVLTVSSCNTNAFDYSEGSCLSEAFMRNPSSGILAYIGNSREGFLVGNYPCVTLYQLFYQKIFTSQEHQVGKALMDAKNECVGFCFDETLPWRWTLFNMNMLGDPETPIFIHYPQTVENIYIWYSPGSSGSQGALEMEPYEPYGTNEANHYTVCFMSLYDKGESYYIPNAIANGGGEAYDECTVCITRPGYIPYMGLYGDIIHLQNETIKGDRHLFAQKAFIGKSVTTKKDQGPVSIEKGKTTIEANKEVTIPNGFDVKLGAEFEIKINNQ